MALPALTLREKILYKDQWTAWAKVENDNGEPISYVLATNPDADGTPLENIPGNFHLTPNFDQPRSPAGQDKVTNYETSNLLTCQRQVIISPDWRLTGITRWGDAVGPFNVDGESEREVLVPCTCVFLVPDIKIPGVS